MKTRLSLWTFLFLAILVVFSNCRGEKDPISSSDDYDSAPIRIMPLGNSITYGNYHPETRPEGLITGYRQALWIMLKEAGYHVDFVGSRTTGADAVPAFDANNEGYPGWTDDQIKVNVFKWLKKNPADIIILHIGTNGLDPDPSDVEGILDEIDRYENKNDHHIKVVMAKIINRSTYSQLTTQFNQNIEKMALDRVVNDGDDIVVIDMEFETDIDYRLNTSGGEMFDNLHPFVGGHEKMAMRWFEALQDLLPPPDQNADPPQEAILFSMNDDTDSRVKEGLMALYKFTEGEGNLVHDLSGVGSPIDLYINHEGNITWDSVQGLEITREAILIPSDINPKITDACLTTNAIALEAWIRTGNIEQSGPADIINISDPQQKGITLSQESEYTDTAKYFFITAMNNSSSNPDNSPALTSNKMLTAITLQHLVYTRDASGNETFYVDGEEAGTGISSTDFSSWNKHTFKLSLCNSLGFENGWTGKLFLTAIYNSALTSEEVKQNFNAGIGTHLVDPVLPEKPAELATEALSAVAAKLSWRDLSDDETGFVIERKESGGMFKYVASVTSNTTDFVDADLTANTAYQYRIKALNDFGESAYSSHINVTTRSDELLENVAYGKSATQSSITYDGAASRGVDGNTDGVFNNKSVTHTAYELNAWWEVDLEDIYYIDHMEVWNRIDQCFKDRMARFYIFISEEPFASSDFQSTMDQPGVYSIYQEFFPDPMATFNVARKGRYIRIQLSDSQNINLAEMVVMGNKVSIP